MDKIQKRLKDYPEIHIIKKNEIEPLSQLMTDCYLNEPFTRLQLLGIEKKRARELFLAQCRGQIDAFCGRKVVYSLEGGGGLLIGYSDDELPGWKLVNVTMQSGRFVRRILKKEDADILRENGEYMEKIHPGNWMAQHAPGNKFHILALAVDRSLKGTGAMRKLITPFLDVCDGLHLPITMEVHNPEYLPIYEHFGFEVKAEIESELVDVRCYCLLRQPKKETSSL